MNLRCLVLRHKWRPAEATNEPGLRLVCARCGKLQRGGTPADRGTSFEGFPDGGGP
jgi:hypothetical protein